LLTHVLGRPREWIVAHDEAEMSEAELTRFIDVCERRRGGEPVAYITGIAWFYGREFVVDDSVLIPRPETEHLVDAALGFIRERAGACRVLDVGTGSGAIACTLAAETDAFVDATDISAEAIAIATRNAERLGVTARCRFFHGDIVAPVAGSRYDVVIANLPYVPTADLSPAPDPTSFEPRLALDGGPDGLTAYRVLLREIKNGANAASIVLLEAAPPTIDGLEKLARSALPNFTVSIGNDYAGMRRFVKAEG
jgi:release factor glutamine methyltransferase